MAAKKMTKDWGRLNAEARDTAYQLQNKLDTLSPDDYLKLVTRVFGEHTTRWHNFVKWWKATTGETVVWCNFVINSSNVTLLAGHAFHNEPDLLKAAKGFVEEKNE